MKRIFSMFVVIVVVFAGVNVGAEETSIFNTNFNNSDGWTLSCTEPSKAGVEAVPISDAEDGRLYIHNVNRSNTSCKYTISQKYSFDYVLEFDMKVVSNNGTIIAQVAPGVERTQLNIMNSSNTLVIPSTNDSVLTRPTISLDEEIADWKLGDIHSWKISTSSNIQTVTIDDIEVYRGGTQKPWNSEFTLEFFANGGENEFYVENCRFSSVDGSSILLDTDFANLDGWIVTKPEGNIVEVETDGNVTKENCLVLNNKTRTDVSAKYTESVKKRGDYKFETKMKILQNKGNFLFQIMPGFERSQININDGGNKVMIPSTNNEGVKENITVILSSVIENYKPNDWHIWSVEATDGIQIVKVDGTVIFSGGTQKPWSNNLTVEYFINSGENEIYVDWSSFVVNEKEFIPEVDMEDIEQTYGEEVLIYDQNNDGTASFINNNGDNIKIDMSSEEIHIRREGAAGDFAYAFMNIETPSGRMVFDFDMKVNDFSRENTVLLRNGNCRVQLMFFADRIQYRNQSGSTTNVPASIGKDWHSYRIFLYDKIAQVYIDGKFLVSYRTQDIDQSAIIQFVCNNNEGKASDLQAKNIKLKNIKGSIIMSPVKFMYGENEAEGIIGGETLTCETEITNYSSKKTKINVIMCFFDENDKITAMKFTGQDIYSTGTKKYRLEREIPAGTERVTVFLWNNLVSRAPLFNSCDFKN